MSLIRSDRTDSILVIDDDNDVLYTARFVLRGLFGKIDTLDRPGLIPEYLKAGATFQTDKVFVGVLIFAISGMVLTEVVDRAERRFDRWRPKVGAAA